MEQLQQPEALELHGNLVKNWRRWKTTLHDIMTATGKTGTSPKRDCLVCGIINNRTWSHLLKKADLTLAGALDIFHADEAIPTTNVGNNSTHNNQY